MHLKQHLIALLAWPAGDEFISGLDEAWAAAGGDDSGGLAGRI